MTGYPSQFRQIWFVDFEYVSRPGEVPVPVCMVAREYLSGEVIRIWQDSLHWQSGFPFASGADVLFVAYASQAEFSCYLALGWPLPRRVLDLFVEFRCLTNGQNPRNGNGLLGACATFGIDTINAAQKDSMRDLVLEGGPWSDEQRLQILDYCQSDVDALEKLFTAMSDHIDWPRALLRGREMKAIAHMERRGVPIDVPLLRLLQHQRDQLKAQCIAEVNQIINVYDGESFREKRFEQWLVRHGIAWPRLPSGRLALNEETFALMADSHPDIRALVEVKRLLAQLRPMDFHVGPDGQNRTSLWPFSSKTGRNQPKSGGWIFGSASWLRYLIRPTHNRTLAYLDWAQQEFGIAAALSNDAAMMEAYRTGDPYLAFAQQAGAAPPDATKSSHKDIRDRFKQCALGVLYGMGVTTLASRLRCSQREAQTLLDLHRRTYPQYWRWSESVLDAAHIYGGTQTVFGWSMALTTETKVTALQNFPMQANGAEMMRLAATSMVEAGLAVCAPIHDAFLIEAPSADIETSVRVAECCLEAAGEVVLGGFKLRSETQLLTESSRLIDPCQDRTWVRILRYLDLSAASLSCD